MKKLIAFVAALCVAFTAAAAPPKKDDKGRGKDKKPEKETPEMMWTVVVEGAAAETAGEEVKAFLSAMRGVRVVSAEKKENLVEAVISSKMRVSRSDVSKALKEKKELKVKDFKVKRPDKDAGNRKDEEEGSGEKKGTEGDKPAEAKKEEPKKAEEPKKN